MTIGELIQELMKFPMNYEITDLHGNPVLGIRFEANKKDPHILNIWMTVDDQCDKCTQ